MLFMTIQEIRFTFYISKLQLHASDPFSSTYSTNSCLIMLLCLFIGLYVVWMGVTALTLCQCVCSSNTGFSPHYFSHLFPCSPLLAYYNYQPYIVYLSILHPFFTTILTIHLSLSSSSPLHPSVHSLTDLLWFAVTVPALSSLLHDHFALLFPSPNPSLFHTVLCASLSLAGLLLGGREFVCTQVPAEHPLHPGSQPGSASLLLILLLPLPPPPLLTIAPPFTVPLH